MVSETDSNEPQFECPLFDFLIEQGGPYISNYRREYYFSSRPIFVVFDVEQRFEISSQKNIY